MGKFSKMKGTRVERLVVNKLKEGGVNATRVPLSGAMASNPDDIILDWLGDKAQGEVKARADGFKEVYKWIAPVRVLFLKANRKEVLAVLRISDFIELLTWANYAKFQRPYDTQSSVMLMQRALSEAA